MMDNEMCGMIEMRGKRLAARWTSLTSQTTKSHGRGRAS